NDADIDDVDAGGEKAVEQAGTKRRRRKAAIASQGDVLLARAVEDGGIGAAEVGDERVIEVGFDHAADVVFAKDLRVHLLWPCSLCVQPAGALASSMLPPDSGTHM